MRWHLGHRWEVVRCALRVDPITPGLYGTELSSGASPSASPSTADASTSPSCASPRGVELTAEAERERADARAHLLLRGERQPDPPAGDSTPPLCLPRILSRRLRRLGRLGKVLQKVLGLSKEESGGIREDPPRLRLSPRLAPRLAPIIIIIITIILIINTIIIVIIIIIIVILIIIIIIIFIIIIIVIISRFESSVLE